MQNQKLPAPLTIALAFLCLALPVSIAGVNIGLAALTLCVLPRKSVWPALKSPAMRALLVYCAVSLVVSLSGVDPARSLGFLHKDFHKVWALGVLLMAFSQESAQPDAAAAPALAAGFALVACVGLWQAATQRLDASTWLRPHAFVHPVTYGEQLALGWLGGFCFLRQASSPQTKRAAAAFLILASAALIVNQTRGALLGLAAGFAALCAIDRPIRKWGAVAAVAFIGAFAFWEVVPVTGSRALGELLRDSQAWSATGQVSPQLSRVALWDVAWRSFKDRPWTGVGPGNYRLVFDHYHQGLVEGRGDWGSAHNLYLHQLSERGLAGLAALVYLLSALTVGAWRRARSAPNAWTLWAASAMAAFLVMNVTEVAFQNDLVATLLLFIWARGQAPA